MKKIVGTATVYVVATVVAALHAASSDNDNAPPVNSDNGPQGPVPVAANDDDSETINPQKL